MAKLVPVTLLTGYLGAGKTTLLNYVLNNQEGYKVAVIVNDIGEVNIDADLIAKGGAVTESDDSLVPLSNGCICCSLKTDLMNQIISLCETKKFDYILIEASGICEPVPIVQTISMLDGLGADQGIPAVCRLDNVVSVVDAYRLACEFGCGENLLSEEITEHDIESLVIQQIEFCNTVILNKVDLLKPDELERVKKVVRSLQKDAKIIETNYGKVEMSDILNTNAFDFEQVCSSSGWAKALEEEVEEEHHHDDHHHDHEEHHHHDHEDHEHHHHDDGEHHHDHSDCDHEHGVCHCGHHHGEGHEHGEEFGITTFVYYRRAPFDNELFTKWVDKWPKNIIRCKGLLWYYDDMDTAYVFEQSGKQIQSYETGRWVASAPVRQQQKMLAESEELRKSWDEKYGDRMIKLVFIGQNLNEDEITSELDKCLFE